MIMKNNDQKIYKGEMIMKTIPFDLKTYADFERSMFAHKEIIVMSDNIDQTNAMVAWFIRHHDLSTMLIHFGIHANDDLKNGYGVNITTYNMDVANKYAPCNPSGIDVYECYIFDGYSSFMNDRYWYIIKRIRSNKHAFIIFICRNKNDLIINDQLPVIFKIPTRNMSAKKEWSEEEDNFLLNAYPVIGSIGCAAYINDAREIECYRRYVYVYGEKMNSASPENDTNSADEVSADATSLTPNCDDKPDWSEIDDGLFNRRWDDLGIDIVTLFPGKTVLQCLQRAMELNLIKETSGPWTKNEDKIILQFYPSMGSDAANYLPGRTKAVITRRYNSLTGSSAKEQAE